MIRKPVIGLIGAIGAGKSTAAKLLAEAGGYVIDADKLGHEAIDRPEVLAKLVERWGSAVANTDGSANRRAIAGIVFPEVAERKWLESVLFPIIGSMAKAKIDGVQHRPEVKFVAVDAAMLLEANWTEACDRIIYLDAPRELRLARVQERSGWSERDLADREAAQLPAEVKRAKADAVLINDGTAEELRSKLNDVLKEILRIDHAG